MITIRKILILTILVFVQSISNAQSLIVSKLNDNCGENKFPLIKSVSAPIVAEKINTLLQTDLLEIVPGAFNTCAFENVAYDSNNCCAYTSFYEFSVTTNSNSILSFYIEGETMGAYPENATWRYNFNAVTGDQILPEEIFTKDGYESIKEQITLNRREKVMDFLDQLNEPSVNKKSKDQIEYEDTQKEVYQFCLDYIDVEDFEYGSFLIINDKIIFTRSRCSNHAMRAVDELSEFYDEMFIKDVKDKLSEYGKALFANDTNALKLISPSIKYNKILKGYLNSKIPITCIFKKPNHDGSLRMIYWYNTHKSIIEWHGTLTNDKKLELVEDDYHDENLKRWIARAFIDAEINGNTITGVWKDQKTGKNLPLVLTKF